MSEVRSYASSDYAGLDFEGGAFYYGYEESICTTCGKDTGAGSEYCDEEDHDDREWCFVATMDGEITRIPFSALPSKEMFNVVGCLLDGIGVFLSTHKGK
jgi:hypothetical protein